MCVIIEGVVEHGDGRGRNLGFATANIDVGKVCDAVDGVYAVRAEVDGERYEGMANLGRKPTFGAGGDRVLEVNLFGFEGDLYGKRIKVELLSYIRSEKAFPSAAELKKAVGDDRRKIEEYFKSVK